jgi:hypothetical protein
MTNFDLIIDGLLAKHTNNKTGIEDPAAAQSDLADMGRMDPDLMEPEVWAAGKMESYKNRHSMLPAGTPIGQTVFGFAILADSIVVLSEGKNRHWVRFKHLTPALIDMRTGLVTKKAAEHMQAAAHEMQFWNNIRQNWDRLKYPNIWDFIESLKTP